MKKKKGFLNTWKKIANKIAKFQTILIMSVIYFLLVPFFSLIRLSDPLKLKIEKKSSSYWLDRKEIDFSIESMRHLG